MPFLVHADDPELVYECRPGAREVKDGVPLEINSAGFRGAEMPVERRPGVRRVAVVGDSVTFAEAVPNERTFAAQAANRLGAGWEVFNFGVTGYNSDQERIVLDRRVLPYAPDLVVIAYCMNDVTPTDGLGALCMASHPSSWGRRLHSQVVTYVSDQVARRRSWKNRSFDRPAKLFERLAMLTKGGPMRALVVLFPQLDEANTGWNRPEEYDKARGLAESAGLEVLDLRQEIEKVPAASRGSLFLDRTHLSPAGHDLVAGLLADAVRRRLAAK